MGQDLRVLRDVLQTCLDELNEWFTERGLRISPQKSYCMIVNKGRGSPLPPNLTLNGTEIPFVEKFKYLGVTLDTNLSWKPHLIERINKAKRDLMIARKLVSCNWGLNPERMTCCTGP